MWSHFSFIKWIAILSMFIACNDDSKDKQILWEKIEPYFSPPSHVSHKYGSYRSPLKFALTLELEISKSYGLHSPNSRGIAEFQFRIYLKTPGPRLFPNL